MMRDPSTFSSDMVLLTLGAVLHALPTLCMPLICLLPPLKQKAMPINKLQILINDFNHTSFSGTGLILKSLVSLYCKISYFCSLTMRIQESLCVWLFRKWMLTLKNCSLYNFTPILYLILNKKFYLFYSLSDSGTVIV